MRQIALAAALTAALAAPAAAQQDGMEDGFSLMQEGSRLILRGLLDELGPAIEEMEGLSDEMREAVQALASEMGPALRELIALVDEIRYYEAPEVLENGDILIRRKPDAPPYVRPEPEEAAPPEEIEL